MVLDAVGHVGSARNGLGQHRSVETVARSFGNAKPHRGYGGSGFSYVERRSLRRNEARAERLYLIA